MVKTEWVSEGQEGEEGHGVPAQGKKGMLTNLSGSFQGTDSYERQKRFEPGHPIIPKKMDQKKKEDG